MCQEKPKCQKPEKLKGNPQDCSPEQIKECHGDAAEHPCEPPAKPPSGNCGQ